MIVETPCNRFYKVRDAGAGLDHVWLGVELKRVRLAGRDAGFLPKGKPETLVRKAGARIVGEAR